MPDAPATVKFADPELLARMGFAPGGTAAPAAPAAPDFSFDSQPSTDPFVAPTAAPETGTHSNQMHATRQNDTPAPATGSPDYDSSSHGFSMSYTNLTKKQRDIVDAMASSFKISDLFSKRRFVIEWTIIPAQLKIGMQSLTTDEITEFWEALNDLKGSTPYIDAVVAREFCIRSLVSINGKPLPAEKADLVKSFDFSLIQLFFDYLKLFETARMKFLHQADLVQNPMSGNS